MRTFRIHFIRHGLTDGNAEGKYIGVTDLSLTEESADELLEIAQTGQLPPVSLVFSSPLKRCVETCDLLYPDCDPIIIDEWREYDFGSFENKTVFELEGKPEYTAWTSGKASPPNGEDSMEFTKRICNGLNRAVRYMMDHKIYEASAVIHGGVMMSMFAATALPRHRAVEWSSPVGGGFTALITPSIYGKSGVIEIIDTVPSSLPIDQIKDDHDEEDDD